MVTRHLLWSGGWDSTFRLLYTLLVRGETVQPHYVLSVKRKSFAREMQTQVRVQERLKAECPNAASRLLPIRITERFSLPRDPELEAKIQNVRKHHRVGGQYDWLSYYANQLDMDTRKDPLELGIIIGGNFDRQFGHELEVVDVHGEEQLRFREVTQNPNLQMFRYFSMPIQFYTKVQMLEIATAFGFTDLLYESWFCHRPIFNDIPCGVCQPCRDARHKGMTHRFPPLSNLRFSLSKWVARPVKTVLRIPPYDRWQPQF